MSEQLGYVAEMPVDRLLPTADNPRTIREDDPGIKELTESIKTDGVLEPVLARPKEGNGHLDLRAGARRLAAAKLAGLTTIPCIVRDMDDAEAMRVTVAENLHDENLSPLDEARGIDALLCRGGLTREEVAQELGKPVAWVVRRAGLVHLTPAWRDFIESNEDLADLPAANLELIARFPVPVQGAILEEAKRRWRELKELPRLRRFLAAHVHALSMAPWKKECAECQKRSDREPLLFDADDLVAGPTGPRKTKCDARCLDAACWDRKQAEYTKVREKELKDKHGAVVPVKTGYGTPKRPGTVRDWDVDRCKKSDSGAQPCLVVEGPDAGKFFWGRPRKGASGGGGSKASGAKPAAKSLAKRREKYDKARAKLVATAVIERLGGWAEHRDTLPKVGTPVEQLALAAAFGTHRTLSDVSDYWNGEQVHPWKDFKATTSVSVSVDELALVLLGMTLPTLASRLRSEKQDIDFRDKDALKLPETRKVCDLFGLDFKAFEREAAEAKPYPKSWDKLNADGTPKKAAAKKKAKRKAKAKATKLKKHEAPPGTKGGVEEDSEANAEDERVGTPFEGDERMNKHGVFVHGVEKIKIPIPKDIKVAAEIHVIEAWPGDWRAEGQYTIPGTAVGCGALVAPVSIRSTSHATKQAAISQAFNTLSVLLKSHQHAATPAALKALDEWLSSYIEGSEAEQEAAPAPYHYEDGRGRILFIHDGISKGKHWATYYRKGAGHHCVVSKNLPVRPSRAEAQKDLDAWAAKKKLPVCCKTCGCTEDAACPEGCSWSPAPSLCSACS